MLDGLSPLELGASSVLLVGILSDLIELTGGVFRMGSKEFYPEEGPVHDEPVEPFAVEQHAVTNAQFAEFVSDTGYVTVAERPLDQELFPILRLRISSQALWYSLQPLDQSI